MDALPWPRLSTLTAEQLRLIDSFVSDVQRRFTARFFPKRKTTARDSTNDTVHAFTLPAHVLPADTLTVETMLLLIVSFFFDLSAVPTVLPFAVAQVPSLARMAATQARITCLVVAAVATRAVVTLHDLQTEVCVTEGVEQFVELGFGRHLHALPVAQQYFKLPPTQPHAPVSSADFVAFLCRDACAQEELLQSQGDARDAINAFAHWYTRRTAGAGTNTGLQSNRQLGIHIQSLPALQLLLRQFASHATTVAEQVVVDARTQLANNATFYTRLVKAVDSALSDASSTDVIGTAMTGAASAVTCCVHMSEAEAAETSVPHRLWSTAPREATRGGVCLKMTVSSLAAVPTRAARPPPLPLPPSSASAQSGPLTTQTQPLATASPVASSLSRRRGRVIVDSTQVASAAVVPTASVTTSHAQASCALPFGFTPLGLAEPASQSGPSGAVEGQPDAANKEGIAESHLSTTLGGVSPEEQLSACLLEPLDAQFAERAIDTLSALCVGDVVQMSTVVRIFSRLSAAVAHGVQAGEAWCTDLLDWCRETAFIPLLQPSSAATAAGIHVVRDVASASEVYCPRSCPAESAPSVPTEVAQWLSRSLLALLDAAGSESSSLRGFLLDHLGVPSVPTLRCWLAAVDAQKRREAGQAISWRSLTESTLRALDVCVRCEHATHLTATKGDGAAALKRLLMSVPTEDAMNSAVFPLDGAWRRGRADLFFCGPFYMHYTDACALVAASRATAPLLVLPFPSAPHYAVQAVLEHFGVRPLDACVVKTVRLETMAFVEAALDIHRKLQLVLPFVQAHLRRTDPSLYHLTQSTVLRRLRTFRVVLGRDATLQATLHLHGTAYTLSRSFPLLYVPQHNTLYGEDSACTPHVLASALCALFLPLTPEAALEEALQDVLRRLLTVVTTASGELLSAERLAVLASRVAEEAAGALGIQLGSDDSKDDEPWSLSAPPFARFQAHFPPGTDGTSSPAPFHKPSPALPAGGLCPARQAQTPCDVPSPASLLVAFSPNCAEKQWARSLPQWQSSSYNEYYDTLQQFLRTERGHAQAGTAAVPRGHTAASDAWTTSHVDAHVTDDTEAFLGFCSHAPFPGAKRSRVDTMITAKSARQEHTGVGGDGGYRGSDESAAAVASEAFVYRQLVKEYAAQDPSVEVLWVNEQSERGTPYDILIVRRRSPHQCPNVIAFVEVKSTTQAHRADFEMSLRELLFAARYGSAYQIHRVFKASASRPDQMRVQVLSDVVSLWHRGKLTMTGEVRVMPAT